MAKFDKFYYFFKNYMNFPSSEVWHVMDHWKRNFMLDQNLLFVKKLILRGEKFKCFIRRGWVCTSC